MTNLEKFNVRYTFANEGYIASVIVGTVEATNREEAMEKAKYFEAGDVFFSRKQSQLFHEKNGEISVIDENLISYCELYVHQDGNWKDISFSELIKGMFKEAIERGKDVLYFENLAYGVELR